VSTTRADRPHPASYRDPSGFLFTRGGVLYRHVAPSYAADYDALMSSGLYEQLTSSGRLVRHQEVDAGESPGAHRVLKPDRVPFVSYPYEWCFSQLRAAARLTLDLLEAALERGLVLKDASALNVQFVGAEPCLIDTLSFEAYQPGAPWVAYRQFCEHFLAPLALMAYRDARLAGLWRAQLDGIPLDLASRLLPRRTWGRFGLLTHVHLHARSQARYADRPAPSRPVSVPLRALKALASSLRSAIDALPGPKPQSAWVDYDRTHTYSEPAQAEKEALVGDWLKALAPSQVWDLGANVGRFSRLAVEAGAYVVAFDSDPDVVEAAYGGARRAGTPRLLPLVMDLANPSPGLGWAGAERDSLGDRGPADVVLALAVVHHLALGRNVPLPLFAEWLARLGPTCIVEFVPKDDPQAQRLLRSRRDVFSDYGAAGFERAFSAHFDLAERRHLADSGRALYRWTLRA
jgi:hypothetical protein